MHAVSLTLRRIRGRLAARWRFFSRIRLFDL
jgi:hypothetical protein